jgi:hypothetical protein
VRGIRNAEKYFHQSSTSTTQFTSRSAFIDFKSFKTEIRDLDRDVRPVVVVRIVQSWRVRRVQGRMAALVRERGVEPSTRAGSAQIWPGGYRV